MVKYGYGSQWVHGCYVGCRVGVCNVDIGLRGCMGLIRIIGCGFKDGWNVDMDPSGFILEL